MLTEVSILEFWGQCSKGLTHFQSRNHVKVLMLRWQYTLIQKSRYFRLTWFLGKLKDHFCWLLKTSPKLEERFKENAKTDIHLPGYGSFLPDKVKRIISRGHKLQESSPSGPWSPCLLMYRLKCRISNKLFR